VGQQLRPVMAMKHHTEAVKTLSTVSVMWPCAGCLLPITAAPPPHRCTAFSTPYTLLTLTCPPAAGLPPPCAPQEATELHQRLVAAQSGLAAAQDEARRLGLAMAGLEMSKAGLQRHLSW
jgi:hypothetical protein